MHVSSDGNEVRIKVIDTGIGLSPDDVSHIFDRFYQAENGKQVAGANPGTGLGLALSKNIIIFIMEILPYRARSVMGRYLRSRC